MKVLVCGSRDWTDAESIRAHLSQLPAGTLIIHGAARGADQLAGRLAQELGLPTRAYPADWGRFGRIAGKLRNLEMLDQRPDYVYAFWNGHSRGTKHTIDMALARGIPLVVTTKLSPPPAGEPLGPAYEPGNEST